MRPWVKFILERININAWGAVSNLEYVRMANRIWPDAPVWQDFVDVLKLSALPKVAP